MSTVVETTPTGVQPETVETGTALLARIARQPLTVASALTLALLVIATVLAPLLAPYGPLEQDLANALSGPSADHLLGTDQLGRDILSRILYGGRVTLLGVLQAVAVCTVLGLPLGIAAGTLGGWVEMVFMRVADILFAVPALVILLVVLAIFGQSETAAMVTLGVILSPTLMRVVYSATIAAREEPYVAGARVAGLTSAQIMRRHILPTVAGPALTQISIVAALATLVEAAVGFLGLGVAPPTPSWGNMVGEAQQVLVLHPWMLVPTGGIIAAVALTLTLLGNGIRDAYAGRSSESLKAFSWRALRAQVTRDATGTTAVGQEPAGPLLNVDGLCVTVPKGKQNLTLVDGVSFDVRPGEALGIVGESGCGKSMTISGVLRVLPLGAHLRARSVSIKGVELADLSERELNQYRGRGIAFISQEPISALNPAFTVGHQVAEAVRLHRRVGKAEARRVALELMVRVRLPEPEVVARKYPHELSGGMAQRINIARALAGEPELLIADEPTTALDVSVQAEILDLLRDLREQSGMALILVTHDWGVVAEACDRAMVMYAGEVVETADVRTLVKTPRHPYTQALLRSSSVGASPRQMLPMVAGSVPMPGSWPTGCRFAGRCEYVQERCTTAPIALVATTQEGSARCVRAVSMLEEAK